MQIIEDGWTGSETVHVDGFNTSVEIDVCFADGLPKRMSIRSEDDTSSLSNAAVAQVLRGLGFAASEVNWEAGEGANEGVAFLSGVVSTAGASA